MLGHSSATVTLDVYSHLFPSLAEQLRSDLDAAYREAKSRASVVDSWCDDATTLIELQPQDRETGG
jgi:hypothetical protein